MRNRILWVPVLTFGLIIVGCNTQNVEPPQPKEQAAAEALSKAPSGPMEMPAGHPSVGKMPTDMPPMEAGPAITGTISIDPALAGNVASEAVLYVIARQEGMRAPIAVARLKDVSFPMDYSLQRQHMMGSPSSPEAKVEVFARLDKDGFVGPPQPGDIEGTHPNPISMGDKDINITLDKLIK